VQGVGAKVALAVLSTLPPADLANAIALRDKAAVTRTPGVGPKVAERIRHRTERQGAAFASVDPALVHLSGCDRSRPRARPVTDAISALVNLVTARRRPPPPSPAPRASPARVRKPRSSIKLG